MHGAKLGRLTLAVALICTLAFSRGASPHSAYALTFAVAVLDNSYNPEPFTIAPGTIVVWTNRGHVAHTVTSDDPTAEAFDSNTMVPGKTFSHVFNHAGVFTYHCSLHDNMLGTIIVETSPAAGSTDTSVPTATRTEPIPVPTRPQTPQVKRHTIVLTITRGGVSRFNPKIVKIKVGTVVTWKNSTAVFHTVTSRIRGWSFKKSLRRHGTVSFTFRKPGTYAYYCIVHPGMAGTIVVHR
jgi:plastocyanin